MSIQHDDESKPVPVPGPRCRCDQAKWVDPAIWDRQDMRYALAVRDIAKVYRLLQRFGVSQRRIAARVEQAQSEVSEIIGGRKVVAYDVLIRIADGLGVPRGWMGLQFSDAGTAADPEQATTS